MQSPHGMDVETELVVLRADSCVLTPTPTDLLAGGWVGHMHHQVGVAMALQVPVKLQDLHATNGCNAGESLAALQPLPLQLPAWTWLLCVARRTGSSHTVCSSLEVSTVRMSSFLYVTASSISRSLAPAACARACWRAQTERVPGRPLRVGPATHSAQCRPARRVNARRCRSRPPRTCAPKARSLRQCLVLLLVLLLAKQRSLPRAAANTRPPPLSTALARRCVRCLLAALMQSAHCCTAACPVPKRRTRWALWTTASRHVAALHQQCELLLV